MEEEFMIVKKKKNNKVLIITCIVLAILLLGGGGFYYYKNFYNKDKTTNDTTNNDDKPRLQDDFYESVNYETLKKAIIPSDNNSWSKGYAATKTIEKRKDEIIEEILSDANYTNEEIDNVTELFNDYEGRNKRGISELQPYFDMIDKAKTIEEFNNVIIKLDNELDITFIINYESANDLDDSSKKVLGINPIKIQENSLELFTESKYANYVPIIKKQMKQYLTIAGYKEEECDELVKQVEEFAKLIQSKSIRSADVTDIVSLYKKYTLAEINKEIKNIPINKLLTSLKIDNLDYYVFVDMGHYKALDEYYTIDHLPLFKVLAKIDILSRYSALTTEKNAQMELDINNEAFGTKVTLKEMNENTLRKIKEEYVDDELQKRYEAKYFTDADKKIVTDLVEEIRKYYKEEIKNATWLSDTTKEKAIKKLEAMKVNVGYQGKTEKNEDEYKIVPKSKGGTLLSNLIAENKFNTQRYYKRFQEEASIKRYSTLTVNAYYSPQENSINFLAGFKEIYGNETNEYKLLGYFGTVIGHEISHAFDNTGSKFDENGKVNNWWTEEDKTSYEKLTEKIKNYYSNYEFMGLKVDGKNTLGENIADLAAVKAMINIAESKGATNDDFKKLFEAYADLWATKINQKGAESQIISDEHAPNKIRVNAVLSSMDKFYEVYDIKETDKMYVAKENRVGLW